MKGKREEKGVYDVDGGWKQTGGWELKVRLERVKTFLSDEYYNGTRIQKSRGDVLLTRFPPRDLQQYLLSSSLSAALDSPGQHQRPRKQDGDNKFQLRGRQKASARCPVITSNLYESEPTFRHQ